MKKGKKESDKILKGEGKKELKGGKSDISVWKCNGVENKCVMDNRETVIYVEND